MKLQSQVAPILEIVRLHNEIATAARTSLDSAIRIGELLVQEKARLGHGQWLPWLKANAPFSDRTARNYIRCFDNREQLKLESVSDLTAAYRQLAPPPEPASRPAAHEAQTSTADSSCPLDSECLALNPTEYVEGCVPSRSGVFAVSIHPSVNEGFFFVNAIYSDHGNETGGAALEGTEKAVHGSAVAWFVNRLTEARAESIEWDRYETTRPWKYNEYLFNSHEEFMNKVILGNRAEVAR